MKSRSSTDSVKLKRVQSKWLELYRELHADQRLRSRLAAPFLSVPPSGYDAAGRSSILLVGRATEGRWCGTRNPSVTVAARRKATDLFLKEPRPSSFWHFAGELSRRVACIRGDWACGDRQNCVWTNVCKLGEIDKNPSGKVFRLQHKLAIETLRVEIETYRPDLVVFVNGDGPTSGCARRSAGKNGTVARGRDLLVARAKRKAARHVVNQASSAGHEPTRNRRVATKGGGVSGSGLVNVALSPPVAAVPLGQGCLSAVLPGRGSIHPCSPTSELTLYFQRRLRHRLLANERCPSSFARSGSRAPALSLPEGWLSPHEYHYPPTTK